MEFSLTVIARFCRSEQFRNIVFYSNWFFFCSSQEQLEFYWKNYTEWWKIKKLYILNFFKLWFMKFHNFSFTSIRMVCRCNNNTWQIFLFWFELFKSSLKKNTSDWVLKSVIKLAFKVLVTDLFLTCENSKTFLKIFITWSD